MDDFSLNEFGLCVSLKDCENMCALVSCWNKEEPAVFACDFWCGWYSFETMLLWKFCTTLCYTYPFNLETFNFRFHAFVYSSLRLICWFKPVKSFSFIFVWILREREKLPSVRKIWILYFCLRARTHNLEGTWTNTTLENMHRRISIWMQLHLIFLSFHLLCGTH